MKDKENPIKMPDMRQWIDQYTGLGCKPRKKCPPFGFHKGYRAALNDYFKRNPVYIK